MKNFLNFLNRNLTKIIWMLAILVWVGVGIYYFSTEKPEVLRRLTFQLAPQPTEPPVSENLDETKSLEESLVMWDEVKGNFEKWEEVENSPDKYILLTDSQTNQVLSKIRVGFEFGPLYGNEGSEDITVFAVEKGENEYDILSALKYFASEEINKLIKKGDPVKIFLKRTMAEEESVKDDQGNFVAHWFIIKRTNGIKDIEQELGREIKESEAR